MVIHNCPAEFFIAFAANPPHDPSYLSRWGAAAGRGFTTAHAQFAAVCEAVERACLISEGAGDPRLGPPSDAARRLPASNLWQYSTDQLRSFDALGQYNATLTCGQGVDSLWATARNLADGALLAVPATAALLGEDVRLGLPPGLSSSSGTAARDTFDAAVRHAVLERLERDAVAIWWYNRLVPHRIEATLAEAALPAGLVDWLRRRRRTTWHLRLPYDLPVCPVVTLSAGPGGADPAIGAAAALDPHEAIVSSTLEMLQGEIALAHMARAQAAPAPPPPPPLYAWSRATRAFATPHLLGQGLASLPPATTFDAVKDALAEAGIAVAIIDLSRPQFPVPVARAVSAELRDWQPRFAPGRLFDVPVHLGLRARPTRPAELNPVPFVI